MNNLSFNDQSNAPRRMTAKKTMADRLIGWGIVKNKKQADLILIGFIIIGFALTFYNMSTVLAPTAAPDVTESAL